MATKKTTAKKSNSRRLKDNVDFVPAKQGQSHAITINNPHKKDMDTIRKTADGSNITMRDGKPQRIYFKSGVEIGAEHVG